MSSMIDSVNISNAITTKKDSTIKPDDSWLSAPAWLTKNYVEQCLKTYYQDTKLKISKMVAKPALGKGENYGGVLTRIHATFQTVDGCVKNGYYIVKTSFEDNELARTAMAPYDIFNREISIYENVLPKLNALLNEIGDDEQIFAETIAIDHERSALIFEDLNVREFVMPDRLLGMDMDLMKIVLRKLAKMHAASAVLNERTNGTLERYDRGFYNKYTESYAPCFVGLLAASSRMVGEWEGYELYAKKLAALTANHMKLGKRVFECVRGDLNVLVHGDLWTNNILVQYDKISGKPVDVKIIDFQYSAWGSPAIDLFYLLNTSLPEELHLDAQDELIQYYYYILAENLRKLSYQAEIPTLHKFHLQLDSKYYYAFSSTVIVQPVQRNVETEDADFNSLMLEDERAKRFKDTCYKNPYCQRIIRKYLPMYERKGLLELDQ